MGNIIDLQLARQNRDEWLREQGLQAAGVLELDRAVTALEPLLLERGVGVNVRFIQAELLAIHGLVSKRSIESAIDRVQQLASRLAHASARQSS